MKENNCPVELKNAEIGDMISFGRFNGNTEWIVLDKVDGRLLVISKYAIERRPYHDIEEEITWENCALRMWLNESFILNAFSSDEQALIAETTVENNTFDRVFLLSVDEAKKYFPSDGARCAELTSGSTGTTPIWWWLRSPGSSGRLAADVTDYGHVDAFGFGVDDEYLAVRPAMWIDISNL